MSEQEVQQYQPVEVQYVRPTAMLNPQDLAELGALQVMNGMTSNEVRAFIAKVQQFAVQSALAMAPDLLEQIRKIQEARLVEIYTRIRLLPIKLGYVSRDSVLAIIQSVAGQAPKQ